MCDVCWRLKVALYALEMLEGELCLLEALHCVTLYAGDVRRVRGVGGVGGVGGAGGDALSADMYIGGCGGWALFAGGDALCAILFAGGVRWAGGVGADVLCTALRTGRCGDWALFSGVVGCAGGCSRVLEMLEGVRRAGGCKTCWRL